MSRKRHLAHALAHAHRAAMLRVIRDNPSMTLAQLARLSKKNGMGSITIREIVAGPTPAPRQPSDAPNPRPRASTRHRRRRALSTRTPSDRANLDQALVSTLAAHADWLPAEQLRQNLGGTPTQIRAALKRLIAGGMVLTKGRLRATRYRAV